MDEKYLSAVGFEPTPFLTCAFNQHLRPLNQACVLPLLSENVQLRMTRSDVRWKTPQLTKCDQLCWLSEISSRVDSAIHWLIYFCPIVSWDNIFHNL